MENDRKTLLLALLIIGVAVFSFNVFDITGQAVKVPMVVSTDASTYEIPDSTGRSRGSDYNEQFPITVTLDSGENVRTRVLVERANGATVTSFNLCNGGSLCSAPQEKTVFVSLEPGQYYLEVQNKQEKARSNTFDVVLV